MLMNVSSLRYPLARHLAAWKMPLSASMRALLWPESQRARMASRCLVTVFRAVRTGLSRSISAMSERASLTNLVSRHFAACLDSAGRTQRSVSLTASPMFLYIGPNIILRGNDLKIDNLCQYLYNPV